MKNQIKENTRSLKMAFIAVATATVIGFGAAPAQAFTSAPGSTAVATQVTDGAIEQAGFRRHKGFRNHRGGRHSFHRSNRGFHGGHRFRGNRYGSYRGGHSSHGFAKKHSYRGHNFHNKHRGHGYNHGVKIGIFGLR